MNATVVARTIDFIFKAAGIVLTPEKAYFIEARLSPVLREEKLTSLDELLQRVERGDRRLRTRMIDALTTNETFFFRDRTPFDLFRSVMIPDLVSRRPAGKALRIWCAACSSGQEPYSLIMTIDQMRTELGGRPVEILATDISEAILAKARSGLYNQFEVQRGLPTKFLMQYFEKQGDNWKIADAVINRVKFASFNLLDDPRAFGTFDLIFCRNVLIYFDRPTRRGIFDRLAERLAPDGMLMLGGAESTFGVTERFVPHPKERAIQMPLKASVQANPRAAIA